ncbi:MAG: flagellar protein FlaG [Vallitalea sp.]|jgi:flagellar protein FlaG|nr:flagellar protein FlaG [Vallitalea sp.]
MRIETNNTDIYSSNSQVEMGRKETTSAVKKNVKQPKEIVVEQSIDVEIHKQNREHEVIDAIEKANKHFKTFDRRLEFSIHDKTKQIMVKVINTEDDSIVREIPSEKILDMVAKLWEMSGIFVDEKR